jgi:hypothetical protein
VEDMAEEEMSFVLILINFATKALKHKIHQKLSHSYSASCLITAKLRKLQEQE